MRRYPVPWRALASLAPHIGRGTRTSVDAFSAAVMARLNPAPRIEGLEGLPEKARFILVSNHYQRPGLWILHPAAVITQAIRRRYGPGDPPVRWVVTANWPPVRILGWRFPSPGDWLLPRVARALACYPVAFAGANPEFTARSLRRLLREAPGWERPLGLFPEGVAGTAGRPAAPLAGSGRLIAHLARLGLAAVPAAIWEEEGLVVRFGPPVPSAVVYRAADPAAFLLERVRLLMPLPGVP